MHIEILILLISLRPRHPTNKAQCLHILYNLFLPVTQFGKRIDHNTRDNITEEEFHHHNVDQPSEEFPELEGVHLLADGAGDVDGEHAVDYGIAALFVGGDGYDVEGQGDQGEGVDEEDAEQGHCEQLFGVEDYCLEDGLHDCDAGEGLQKQ